MSQNNTETNTKGGPRTAAGKAASSKNSFKHGLASGQILIDDENPAAFYSLVADLEADYQPATETEALLVHDLAKFHWLADRAIRLQAAAFAACVFPGMPASLNVLIRYQYGADRRNVAIDAGTRRLQRVGRPWDKGAVDWNRRTLNGDSPVETSSDGAVSRNNCADGAACGS